jgi:hypothetical protein
LIYSPANRFGHVVLADNDGMDDPLGTALHQCTSSRRFVALIATDMSKQTYQDSQRREHIPASMEKMYRPTIRRNSSPAPRGRRPANIMSYGAVAGHTNG